LVRILAIVSLIASTGAEEVFAVARRRGAGHVVQKQIVRTRSAHKSAALADGGRGQSLRWQFRLDTKAQIEMEAINQKRGKAQITTAGAKWPSDAKVQHRYLDKVF
jgi:hypothetical protein